MKLFNLTCKCFSNEKTEQYNTRTQLSLEKIKTRKKPIISSRYVFAAGCSRKEELSCASWKYVAAVESVKNIVFHIVDEETRRFLNLTCLQVHQIFVICVVKWWWIRRAEISERGKKRISFDECKVDNGDWWF